MDQPFKRAPMSMSSLPTGYYLLSGEINQPNVNSQHYLKKVPFSCGTEEDDDVVFLPNQTESSNLLSSSTLSPVWNTTTTQLFNDDPQESEQVVDYALSSVNSNQATFESPGFDAHETLISDLDLANLPHSEFLDSIDFSMLGGESDDEITFTPTVRSFGIESSFAIESTSSVNNAHPRAELEAVEEKEVIDLVSEDEEMNYGVGLPNFSGKFPNTLVSSSSPSSSSSSLALYPCTAVSCGKVFANSSALRLHRKVHQLDLPCDICGKVFTNRASYHSHKKSHSVVMACSYCGKTFNRRFNLNRHLTIHQPKG